MIHVGANTIINDWSSDIFVAYSAVNPDPKQQDVWRVARIAVGQVADSVDIDYIRAADNGTSLVYRARRPIRLVEIFSAAAPTWVKIRQFSKVKIETDEANAKNGIIHHVSSFGNPRKALDVAAEYDTGHSDADKQARGTVAVTTAIKEWEDIIAAKQFAKISHKKGLLDF
jgi:hypothetical protein